MREYDTFAIMFADYDQNSPKTLTEKFYLDMDLSNYEEKIVDDDDLGRCIRYMRNGETQFVVDQMIVSGANTRLNTENALVMPQSVSVNNWSGIYYQSYDGCHIFIFNLGDYTITYFSFLDKDYIEELVKSTKFA